MAVKFGLFRIIQDTNPTSGLTENGQDPFPYVYLDATYLHVRESTRVGVAEVPGQLVSKAVVVATGITAAGGREVLGVAVGTARRRRSRGRS